MARIRVRVRVRVCLGFGLGDKKVTTDYIEFRLPLSTEVD